MPITLPFLGLAAVVSLVLAACDSEEKQKKIDPAPNASPPPIPPPPSTPCPPGWSPLELRGNQIIHLCHQDSPRKPDGIYQKESDQLGLRAGDRFISSQDSQFQRELKLLQMPNLEGIKLPYWSKNPRERFQALQIAALLKETQAEGSGFYTTDRSGLKGENKDFIDTVARLMDEGKLKIKNTAGEHKRASYLYDALTNKINIEGEIDLNNLEHRAGIIHELFHFYQDSRKREQSGTDTELQAYLKGAEFLFSAYEKGKEKGEFKDLQAFYESVFKKSGEEMEYSPYERALQAVSFQREGDTTRFREYSDKLKTAINIHYFLLGIYDEVFNEGVLRRTRLILNSSKKNRTGAAFLETLARQIDSHKSVKDEQLKALKTLLKTAPNSPSDDFVSNMKRQVTESVQAWVTLIVLTKMSQAEKQGQSPDKIDLAANDPLVAEMLETLGRLDPYRHYRSRLDGVD
jgi:hypothetical protein